MSLKSERHCGGPRFYEAGYTWEQSSGPLFRIRQLWSVASTTGGKYVSVKTADMGAQKLPLNVTATGEADSQSDAINIKCVKFLDPVSDPKRTVQPWFYLKFFNGQNEYTVSASENGVKASDMTNPGTLFRFVSLRSSDESYLVFQSDQNNADGNPLYLSSNGAGNMKLKVWNSPVPDPPYTSDEVDPALLFRLVHPLGQK